ncbi:MAG: outer membrane protein OmpK, partial [Serratia marcescens]|nr:outer membrane protein OmpK [Serratia marcescens]
MKKIALAAGVLLAASYSASSMADSKDSQYVSDWWHQSVNVVGSYHTRFGPQLNNDVYLEYEAFAKKDWFDFYGYVDVPKFF